MADKAPVSPAMGTSVKETAVADVQLNDDGAPSQVNGYRVLKQLGEGTTSKVYQCQDESGRNYALKILNKSFLKRKREYKKVDGKMVFSNAFQKVQKEVAIMKKLSHENLVKLHEIIDSPADDKMVLVLELITGGQVMKWEEKGFHYRCPRTTTGVMEPDDVRRCMRDVIDALEYLHKNSICHRDIKPENILLASENTYKLADFGVAHMTDDDSGEKKTLRNTEGTYHFLAPECTTGNEYDPYQVDIWALGVTMFTMLFGTLPFGTKAASLTDVMDSIREDPLVLDSENLDSDCEHLLRAMMTKDVQQRITIEQLKRHPWILQGVQPKTLSEPSRVEVTREEIEAAFTPVNNFILMVRIKMKMAGRLARARNSIDLAKNQSSATSDALQRVDTANTLSPSASHEILPAIAQPSGDVDVAAEQTSEATIATSPDTTASPSSSPGKGTIAKLARRLSFKAEPTAPAERPCDSVSPPCDGSSSPIRIGPVTLSKRKSSLDNRLVTESAPETENGEEAEGSSRKEGVTVRLDDSQSATEPRSTKTRASPSRVAHIHLAPDSKLPKLDLTSSPSGSPTSSPIRRKLTPRYSRENVASGWDEPTDEVGIISKSPTEKRHRSPKLHQGVVHPAPTSMDAAGSDIIAPIGAEEDDATETITVSAPRRHASPIRKKTQDEAKAAISNIVHRTNAETTSPSTSPVKEPSVMLQRRKSSMPADTVDDQRTAASTEQQPALPRLPDAAPGRPRRQPSSPTHEATTIGLTRPSKSPSALSPSKFFPSRVRGSEQSIRSERSVCSNGRASNYATEFIDAHGPHGDEPDSTILAEDESAAASHGHSGTPESAKTPRLKSVRENSLTNCLPNPNENDLFVVDASTGRVRKYASHDEAGNVDADGERDITTVKSHADRSPPKVFGLFRKASGGNVAPLDLIPDIDPNDMTTKGEELSPTKHRELDVVLAPVSPRPKAPTRDTADAASVVSSGDPLSSPTTQDLSVAHSPRRAFSPRKSVVQSQDSIRLLVLRRSESVKAMLTGRKTPLEAADDSLERHRSLAVARTKGPSAAAVGGAASPRKSRTNAPKSASCVVQ